MGLAFTHSYTMIYTCKSTILLTILSLIFFGCKADKNQTEPILRLNQIQVIGSHNSYKEAIEPALLELMLVERPKTKSLDYRHLPIAEQLELGLRSLELDVLHDPVGGHYTRPKGLELLQAQGHTPQPYDTSALTAPGIKTFHIPDIDFRSSCLTFKACLSAVKAWSTQHPAHLPIIITINPKSSGVDAPGFTEVLPFDGDALRALDQEIQDIFNPGDLITPQSVKGTHSSLRAAVTEHGWPDLDTVRGKILFVLDAGTAITEAYLVDNTYHRPMFVNVAPDHDHAAFLIMNDPLKQENEIRQRVEAGFMVRTRADADTREARTGDRSRFEAAIRSGAQVISTDYYLKSLSPNQDFEILFEGPSYSRCNPVLVEAVVCGL